jgi:bifunctional DNA-binding transcriptional regulator/antitoxin component of YhaV-PrlF toxin-antitoxin module
MPVKENPVAVPKEADESTYTVMTENGKIAIPSEFLNKMGLNEGSSVRSQLAEGTVRIEPASEPSDVRANPLAELFDWFAPTRAHVLAQGYTEEEIDADIDAAIAEVRAETQSHNS